MDKIQITTKKDDARMQRFELSEGYDRVTHSRALLIVRQLTYKPVSQLRHKTGKKETLSRANLNLAYSTWARWWRSWPQQDGTPFLIVLAWRSLVDCSPIIHHGRASSSAHLHISMITIWIERFKQMISSRWLILNLHFISSFFIMLISWS